MSILIYFLVFLIGGIAIGLPIAYALILCGVATAMVLGGNNVNPQIIAAQLMRGTDSVTMMALPFFVLAGELMNRGGLTNRIIKFCNIFVGRFRGGLGYVTILACLMFASL
ncbi:MAG: siaT 6, partial [Lacrimispora sp.]|nr:siaT 6 [Lacrimispora sp.]